MKPLILGALMGLVMLAMLHGQIMSGEFQFGWAGIAFVLAHVAVLGVLGIVALMVPALRRRLSGHRPSGRHMATMLAGAIIAIAVVHVFVHGGVA